MCTRTIRPSRRSVLVSGLALALSQRLRARPDHHITGYELLPVQATERTVWLIVRLWTDAGLSGLGEASDAFGFAGTTKANAQRMEAELRRFFELVKGRSPLDVEAYRSGGEKIAIAGGLLSATAYSAIEQARITVPASRRNTLERSSIMRTVLRGSGSR